MRVHRTNTAPLQPRSQAVLEERECFLSSNTAWERGYYSTSYTSFFHCKWWQVGGRL